MQLHFVQLHLKLFVKYNNKARQQVINEYKDNSFVDSSGRTLKEAFEESQEKKLKEHEQQDTEYWLMDF